MSIKNLIFLPFVLTMNYSFSQFGQVVECPQIFKNINTSENEAKCRKGEGNEVSIYDKKDEKVYIHEGFGKVKTLNFNVFKAQNCLDLNRRDLIHDVSFNAQMDKWVIYKTSYYSSRVDSVYLLDKNYDLKKFVLTFLRSIDNGPLDEMIYFKDSKAYISNKKGDIGVVKATLPSLEEIKREAFNFFEMRYTGSEFMELGLGKYPAYHKTLAIMEKCQVIESERKRKRCLQKEGKLLQLDILKYVKENFSNSYYTKKLIEFLGEGNKKVLKRLHVANKLYNAHKEMSTSQVLNLNYPWEENDRDVVLGWNYFRSSPAHQVTFDLNSNMSYFSIGAFLPKPSGLSVRFAYYPIAPIPWE